MCVCEYVNRDIEVLKYIGYSPLASRSTFDTLVESSQRCVCVCVSMLTGI